MEEDQMPATVMSSSTALESSASAAVVEAMESVVESAVEAVVGDGAAAADSKKRKLTKQEKRAAHKLVKKARYQQMKQEQARAEPTDPTNADGTPEPHNPHGTQKRSGAVSEESVLESAYYFRDGYRLTYPYWYEFSTYAKRRWLGRRIIDVLKGEYGNGGKGTDEAETELYYRTAIDSGAFRIDGEVISSEYAVREGDHFQHYQHRHETPVTAEPILVHYQDAHLIVIDKPSSIPVHPCGNYRHNTVLYILAKEHDLRTVFVIHRLDSVTSGLLILAKTPHTARRLSQQITDKEVRKEYLARVQGHFPKEMKEFVLSTPIYQYTLNGQSTLTTTPPTTEKPLNDTVTPPAQPQAGQTLDWVKESITVFTFLSYDAATDSSLVKCCPLTGRTHQIRLHLRHLGYPIANDVRYGGRDTSTGQANDLATVQLPDTTNDDDDHPENEPASAPSTFTASDYWRDTAARKQQLHSETESQRLRRIQSESVDASLSCPICAQAQKAASATGVISSTTAVAPSPVASSSPIGASTPGDLLDAAALSSPFSSTRVRVEYIWLHAYKYSYDPAFKHTCKPTATTNETVSMATSTTPDVIGDTTTASSSTPETDTTKDEPNAHTPSPSTVTDAPESRDRWSYEIPWPQWAIQIAPPHLQQQHQRVEVRSDLPPG